MLNPRSSTSIPCWHGAGLEMDAVKECLSRGGGGRATVERTKQKTERDAIGRPFRGRNRRRSATQMAVHFVPLKVLSGV
ncbi:hypothetical protein NL676_024902 [Syzygium grande]|nr:hypothetical protein NL676_024902 [Syzygium grande]